MGFFRDAVDALFRERHSTTFTVTVPTQLFMAVETLVYIRNETSEDGATVDRDFIVGSALAAYVQKHLVTKNQAKIDSIPPAPPRLEDAYTNGRRQNRFQSYQEYNAHNGEKFNN